MTHLISRRSEIGRKLEAAQYGIEPFPHIMRHMVQQKRCGPERFRTPAPGTKQSTIEDNRALCHRLPET
ncbi:MAG: hypothetical protein WD099_06190 [Dongiaceae bacterium]